MILYYSATGNTCHIARMMAIKLRERGCVDIKESIDREKIKEAEKIGIMFPIYGWDVPSIVYEKLEGLPSDTFDGKFVWSVCTCGDEAGLAMERFKAFMFRKFKINVNAVYSVRMPNTLVAFPGFGIDNQALQSEKLGAAEGSVGEIANEILSGQCIDSVHRGSFPSLRTNVLGKWFNKHAINPQKWHAGSGCLSCGKCASVCPISSITMENGKPVWGNRCLGCCACFHHCPVRCIDYGKISHNKGQYTCPKQS